MKNIENIVETVVFFSLRMFHIDIPNLTVINLIQFIKFGIVGVTNTLVYYFANLLTLCVVSPLRLEKDYIFGNMVGFIVSVLWSFYWNNRFVFTKAEGEQRNLFKTLLKAFAAYAFTGIILSNVISYVLIDKWNLSKYIVPLVNSLVGVPINFVLNKLWAFRSKTDEPAAN